MSINWVDYRATVPDWSVPELNRKVAELSAQAAAREHSTSEETGERRVHKTLEMIKTPDGWALVKTMAAHSLESASGWVEWQKLCDTMNMDGRRLSGVLGNIVKATKNAPPLFDREQVGDRYRFRMNREVAVVVIARARARENDTLAAIGRGEADMFP